MNFAAYQEQAATFAVYPKEHEREYLAFGLIAEVGEVAGLIAKRYRGDDVPRERMRDELGDVAWMAAMIARYEVIKVDARLYDTVFRLRKWERHISVRIMTQCATDILNDHINGDAVFPTTLLNVMRGIVYLAAAEDYTLDDIMTANLAKLADRQARGTLQGEGDDR